MAILTDRQKQKLTILKDLKELHKEFALHMLEEDLGGSRPILTQFMPFPLAPGPFIAGSTQGPDRNAHPCVHKVLTHFGTIGQLWDPKKPLHENKRLEYNPEAADILERIGVRGFSR